MGNLQVRFLEGWAPAMAPGYSTLTGLRKGCSSSVHKLQAPLEFGTLSSTLNGHAYRGLNMILRREFVVGASATIGVAGALRLLLGWRGDESVAIPGKDGMIVRSLR